MPRFVAFLRAVNVGGRTVSMDVLRSEFEALHCVEVTPFLASGNIVFTIPEDDPDSVRLLIEARLRTALGYDVTTFLRSPEEVAMMATDIPFDGSKLAGAVALNLVLLAHPPDDDQRLALQGLTTDVDTFAVRGREIYWLCRKKQSESTFSNAVLERTLGVRSTIRTQNTIVRLASKFGFSPPG